MTGASTLSCNSCGPLAITSWHVFVEACPREGERGRKQGPFRPTQAKNAHTYQSARLRLLTTTSWWWRWACMWVRLPCKEQMSGPFPVTSCCLHPANAPCVCARHSTRNHTLTNTRKRTLVLWWGWLCDRLGFCCVDCFGPCLLACCARYDKQQPPPPRTRRSERQRRLRLRLFPLFFGTRPPGAPWSLRCLPCLPLGRGVCGVCGVCCGGRNGADTFALWASREPPPLFLP